MSDEKKAAQYYQAHKDDEDEWGEPERPPASSRPKRRLASMISVRFSPNEAKAIRREAEAVGESLSQFVRKAALQRCRHHHYAVFFSISGTAQKIIGSQSAWPWTTSTKGSPEAIEGNQWIRSDPLGSTTAGYVQNSNVLL
jgi:hypothetical protein